jgi:hypothetical protein
MILIDVSMKSWRSSVVEQLICNQQVGGSNPFASSNNMMQDAGCKMHERSYYSNHASWIMYHASWVGEVAEWTKAADCKSAGASLRRFESCPPHHSRYTIQDVGCKMHEMNYYSNHASFYGCAGVAQLARASAFQAEGRGFESRLPLKHRGAHVAQSAEHILGKDEVSGSSPLVGSSITMHDARYKIQDTECEMYLRSSTMNHASWIVYREELGGKDNV